MRIVNEDLKAAGRQDVLGALTSYFGSILRARRLARVPDPPRRKAGARWNRATCRLCGEPASRRVQPAAVGASALSRARSAASVVFRPRCDGAWRQCVISNAPSCECLAEALAHGADGFSQPHVRGVVVDARAPRLHDR